MIFCTWLDSGEYSKQDHMCTLLRYIIGYTIVPFSVFNIGKIHSTYKNSTIGLFTQQITNLTDYTYVHLLTNFKQPVPSHPAY